MFLQNDMIVLLNGDQIACFGDFIDGFGSDFHELHDSGLKFKLGNGAIISSVITDSEHTKEPATPVFPFMNYRPLTLHCCFRRYRYSCY
jgi:hypothetical protein